jgi:hypothetical protein
MRNSPELETPIGVYQTRRLQFHHFRGLILCGFFFILLPAAYGSIRLYTGYTQFGPAAGYARGLPWFVAAAAAFGLCLIALIARLSPPQYKIFLYRHGLLFEGNRQAIKAYGSDECLEWEAVSGISVETIGKKIDKGSPSNTITSQKVKLFLQNGKTISLVETADRPGGLKNLPELVSRVKAFLYPRLTPRFKSAFAAGQSLSFGSLSVQKAGIQFRTVPGIRTSLPVPWDQIGHITVKSGYLVVELSQSSTHSPRPKRVPLSQIPNIELLLQIIKENVEG